MMSPAERLVYMANQISRNLAAQGEAHAALATADHIAAFWDPRMRGQILSQGAEGLEPIAADAVRILRDRGSPNAQSAATVFGGGSDAG